MDIRITRSSALDLELKGSVGQFSIAGNQPQDEASLEVMYLSTHIGFDSADASNEFMLRTLQPFRELFDYKELKFEEIMQRDIDDARVSTELIPYLLDAKAQGSIKFFPPIVAVVLPIAAGAKKPALRYPAVIREPPVKHEKSETEIRRIRSGAVGEEAFQFEFPIADGVEHRHDFARLRLNRNRVRLVIIDGQHRAMALLALHRNLRGDWSQEQGAGFQTYYSAWTKERIGKFDLTKLQLPLVVCAFPGLEDKYDGEMDVIQAARKMFLTLNKNARKVSNSRNILLDDRDLISCFLRDALGEIKAREDESAGAMRIWNVELDQRRDRVKIESQVACTGVSHVHYIIEHLMFDENNVKGVSARSGKFYKRSNVESSLLRRLDGENLLPAEAARGLRRDAFSADNAKTLSKQFSERYGRYLRAYFDEFKPLAAHNRASLWLREQAKAHSNSLIRTILFDGQNVGRSFEEYLEAIVREEQGVIDAGGVLPPGTKAVLDQLRMTQQQITEICSKFVQKRGQLFFEDFSEMNKLKASGAELSEVLEKVLKNLYGNVFLSIAFQAAAVCGFFLVVEKAEEQVAKDGGVVIDRPSVWKEYIECLNRFFCPNSPASLRNLVTALFHDVEGSKPFQWTPVKSSTTFDRVVARNEMKPDEWPKYRYLMLELWEPTQKEVQFARSAEREYCRAQVARALNDRYLGQACEKHHKAEKDLSTTEHEEVFNETFNAFDRFLINLGIIEGSRVAKSQFSALLSQRGAEQIDEEGLAAE